MTFIQTLIRRQRAESLSETEFAHKIGISVPYLTMLKNGRRGFGPTVLRGIVRAYPDLEPEVLSFLRDEETIVSGGEIVVDDDERDLATV